MFNTKRRDAFAKDILPAYYGPDVGRSIRNASMEFQGILNEAIYEYERGIGNWAEDVVAGRGIGHNFQIQLAGEPLWVSIAISVAKPPSKQFVSLMNDHWYEALYEAIDEHILDTVDEPYVAYLINQPRHLQGYRRSRWNELAWDAMRYLYDNEDALLPDYDSVLGPGEKAAQHPVDALVNLARCTPGRMVPYVKINDPWPLFRLIEVEYFNRVRQFQVIHSRQVTDRVVKAYTGNVEAIEPTVVLPGKSVLNLKWI